MAFAAVSAGIGAASLLYGVGKGISQSHKANEIDKNNPRPTYQIPEEYKQNLAMAQHMAQIGLPQAQYNNQANAISRNQAGAVASLGNSANPGAGLAGIVRAGNDSIGSLNAADAAARQQNQRGVMAANAQLGQQALAAQQYNKFDKYTEQFNKSAALRGAANANIQNGVNGAAGLAGSLAVNDGNLGFGGSSTGNFGGAADPYATYSARNQAQTGNWGFGLSNQVPAGWGAITQPQQNPYNPQQYGGAPWGVGQ